MQGWKKRQAMLAARPKLDIMRSVREQQEKEKTDKRHSIGNKSK